MSDAEMMHVQCKSDHGGFIITGDATMMIDGYPVARIGDLHSCPLVYPTVPPIPHSITPIIMTAKIESRPLINGMPAAFEGDTTGCGAVLMKCGSSAKGVGVLIVAAALVLPFLFLNRKKSKTGTINTQSTPSDIAKAQTEAISKQINGLTDFINRNLTDNKNQSVVESKSDTCDCHKK